MLQEVLWPRAAPTRMGTVDTSTGTGAGCFLCRVPKELLLASMCDELVYGRYSILCNSGYTNLPPFCIVSTVLDDSALKCIPIAFKQLLLV